jgi:regulator of CtrA degradation
MSELASAAIIDWRSSQVKDFTRSELFARTFAEGMDLVEEAAAYLDGVGRHDSRLLSRNRALAYANQSMRLTTRLMQVASWLLVQRSVRDGEMTTTDARQDRYRLRDEPVEQIKSLEAEELPAGLIDLLQRSERLYGHVLHLDRRMYLEPEIVTQSRANPVLSQFERLNAAFGTKE